MNKAIILPLVAAIFTLSACENKPEVVDTRSADPQKEQLENAAPVELPPSIRASVTFRCQPGNSLMYAEFLSGDTKVHLSDTKGGPWKTLVAPKAGDPYVLEGGYKLTGNEKSSSIEYAGSAPKACKS